MKPTTPNPFPFPPKRIYYGADVPMRVIKAYARAIADEFHPHKIILFGSYAYGTPHDESDVDLMVIMPARDRHAQAVRIEMRLAAPFAMDLNIVPPAQLARRLSENESYMTTVVTSGKVLYEEDDKRVGEKSRTGLLASKKRSNEL